MRWAARCRSAHPSLRVTRVLLPAMAVVSLAGVALSQAPLPNPTQSPTGASGEYSYERRYVEGEIDSYELRTRTEDKGGEMIAVSEHEIVLRDGVPYERIRWVRLLESEIGNVTELTESVAPYELSLHPAGKFELDLPDDLLGSAVGGMLTDLYTLYFAISPQAGVGNVTRAGEVYEHPELIVDDWANPPKVVLGEDRVQVRIELVSAGPDRVRYQTEFTSPTKDRLRMHHPSMEAPVCGNSPNNYQMVREHGPGFLVVWGCERSTITSGVERDSGKIVTARMDSHLILKRKLCANQQLEDCAEQPGLRKHRIVELTHRPRPLEAPPVDRVTRNERDGQEYVWIPPGSFEMGCVPGDGDCYEEETPPVILFQNKTFPNRNIFHRFGAICL